MDRNLFVEKIVQFCYITFLFSVKSLYSFSEKEHIF